jgi:hypothetical protein
MGTILSSRCIFGENTILFCLRSGGPEIWQAKSLANNYSQGLKDAKKHFNYRYNLKLPLDFKENTISFCLRSGEFSSVGRPSLGQKLVYRA